MTLGESFEQVMDAALDAVRTSLEADARSFAGQVRATARLLAAARAGGGADRAFAELEIAGSWSVGQATATRLLVEAEQFTTCLPATLAALETGGLLVHQARVLLHVTRNADPQIARQVELEVLAVDDLPGLCPTDLRALATRVLLRLESEAVAAGLAQARHDAAATQRRTWSRADADGMGVAGALLTAEQLVTWKTGLDALEAQDRRSDRETGLDRTAEQRRADLFAALPALVLAARAADPASPAAVSSALVRPQVVLHVQVPMATVFGLSAEPGHLDGYGPVSAEHVLSMRPTAYRRVVVEHDTGRPVHLDDHPTRLVDDPQAPSGSQEQEHPQEQHLQEPEAERCWAQLRTVLREALAPTVIVDRAEPQHDPSARLGRLVDVRDRRCSGPGCGQTRTHRDHADPWPTGPTAAWNLQRLSARCHRAKHTGWTVQRHRDGSTTWHSPLGRTYQRPSPHTPPPPVDLHAESPPVLARRARAAAAPPPTAITAPAPAPPPAPAPEHPVLPDDPPF